MQLIIAIAIAAVLYGLQQRIYRNMWNKKLNIDIGFQDTYIKTGEKSSIVEVINNDKFLPLPVLHVKFSTSRSFKFEDKENAVVTDKYHRNDVFSVMGNKKVTRILQFTAEKRGFFTITGVNIIAKDFFMTKTFARNIPNYSEIYVFPKKLVGRQYEIMCNSMFGDIETKRSLFEDPFSFRGIREYSGMDSMSKVNWQATARTGQLMVNQYNHTAEYRVKLFLNLDTNYMVKSERIQELGIELISSLAKDFLGKSIPVMYTGNGKDVVSKEFLSVDFGSSMQHLVTIDKCLARIGESGDMEDFISILDKDIQKLDDSMAYVFVSAYYRDDLLLKLDYLVSKGISVTMIVPHYDIQSFVPVRTYMKGWEVKLNET